MGRLPLSGMRLRAASYVVEGSRFRPLKEISVTALASRSTNVFRPVRGVKKLAVVSLRNVSSPVVRSRKKICKESFGTPGSRRRVTASRQSTPPITRSNQPSRSALRSRSRVEPSASCARSGSIVLVKRKRGSYVNQRGESISRGASGSSTTFTHQTSSDASARSSTGPISRGSVT